MTQTTPQTFADITPEMIGDWKAKYGEHSLRQIDVEPEYDIDAAAGKQVLTAPGASFIARVPSRATMDLVTSHSTKGDATAANKSLIAGCILGGDMKTLEDNAPIYVSVLERTREILENRTASLKKI